MIQTSNKSTANIDNFQHVTIKDPDVKKYINKISEDLLNKTKSFFTYRQLDFNPIFSYKIIKQLLECFNEINLQCYQYERAPYNFLRAASVFATECPKLFTKLCEINNNNGTEDKKTKLSPDQDEKTELSPDQDEDQNKEIIMFRAKEEQERDNAIRQVQKIKSFLDNISRKIGNSFNLTTLKGKFEEDAEIKKEIEDKEVEINNFVKQLDINHEEIKFRFNQKILEEYKIDDLSKTKLIIAIVKRAFYIGICFWTFVIGGGFFSIYYFFVKKGKDVEKIDENKDKQNNNLPNVDDSETKDNNLSNIYDSQENQQENLERETNDLQARLEEQDL